MKHINIGLIGLGKIAETSHLLNLKEAENVTIAAVMDVDESRAKYIADTYQVKHYFTEAEKMMEQVSLDAVIICTPNHTHISMAKIAAQKGIHVFMEKPIGTSLEEVEEYLALAKDKNVLTMVGMPHRFRRDASILKEYADSNAFGNIYYAKAKLFRRRGTPKGWFTDKSLAGGGALMDIGVHVLDLAWWILGTPEAETITGLTTNGLGNYQTRYVSRWESSNKKMNKEQLYNVDDFGSAWIRFKNGTVLSLEVAWAMNGEQDGNIALEFLGDKGGGTLSPLTIYQEDNHLLVKTTPLFEESNPFVEELEHFIDCVRNGQTPLVSGEQGYEVLKMLHGIYESSEKGREIEC